MDPTQAAGLAVRPTALLPEVFPRLTPAAPTYTNLASLPAAGIAQLMGGKDTGDFVNNLGTLYKRAGTKGWLPGTSSLMRGLATSDMVDTMFGGVKAGPGDQESYQVPGYVYGQEPLLMGEASTAVGGLLDAALVGEPLAVQQKYGSEGWGGYMIDKWGDRVLKKPVGRGPQANDYVARHLFR